ncbi:acyl-CoA dehydrogenase family protein [Paraburkholderia fungorum]|uniref:acyl-CoA dehydrogenase family protein n=1 Tax=Paraburkholderia fungorum TaxID=134537 RepID=UPI0038BA31B6
MNIREKQAIHAVSEEILMISRSARDFATGIGGVARARKVRDQWPAPDLSAWRQIAAMGWFGMLVPESQGGLGLDARAVVVLGDAIGSALMPEPVISTIAGAWLLARANAIELPAVMEGTSRMTIAEASLHEESFLATVPDLAGGSMIAVSSAEEDGVHLIGLDAQGLTRLDHECVDGSTLSDVTLSRDTWRDGKILDVGADDFAFASDITLLGDSAQLVGAMDAALALTVEYLKTRTQFGVPIGTFQALQHRAASAYVEVAACRALVGEAAHAFGATGKRRALAAAAAKARTAEAATRVMDTCIQLHGAIGFADEHDIGLYYRRAMTLSASGGNAWTQYNRYASLAASNGV